MLPILEIDERFDFQKEGNYNNLKWGLPIAPQNSLLTFHFKRINAQEITTFKAYRVKIVGKEVVKIGEIDLIANKPILRNDGYTMQLQILDTLIDKGLYYFFMSNLYFANKSELFCVKECMILDFREFNLDFNLDFNS